MKQYLDLLKNIDEKGTVKLPARENMPSTKSLFGYQFRHNLQEGFPLLTTKKLSFKNIVVELLWFLRGDANIKYLIRNGCNIWNEDAYHFYVKKCKKAGINDKNILEYEDFLGALEDDWVKPNKLGNYNWGDCGMQYGKLWRDWTGSHGFNKGNKKIDQIKNIIEGLKNNPMSRRHILTAWNPSTLDDMALNACHALVQFNCRPLDWNDRCRYYLDYIAHPEEAGEFTEDLLNSNNVPKYYLDCQMYQRSADVFLGVPYNIASYALLTHILADTCNMLVGEYIHTFGDVHIYDNHQEQVYKQLERECRPLPKLEISEEARSCLRVLPDDMAYLHNLHWDDFKLQGYNPHATIKGKLSTGLK